MKKECYKSKILFITPTLNGGGAEKNLVNIINSLDYNIFNVTLIVCGGEKNYFQLLPSEVNVIYLGKPRVLSSLVDIIRSLQKEKADLIYSSAGHISLIVILYHLLINKQFVNVVRLPSLPSNKLGHSLRSKIISKINPFFFRKVHFLVVQSEQMRKEATELMSMPPSKIITIHNLINKEQVLLLSKEDIKLFNENEFNIVAVGTLYSIKGFDLLIESLSIVKQKIPNIKLHILGKESTEPNYKRKLEDLAVKNGVEKIVQFHGFKSNPYPYMKQADVFVLSSRKEGFPNVVLEALTLGTPVVATNCVDFDQIITNNVNGIIVQKENVMSLAEGIINSSRLERVKFEMCNFDYNKWFGDILK